MPQEKKPILKLFNYLSRQKEQFRPLSKKWVGLYTCGPTVYYYAHIGNLRTYVFEDVLKRTLNYFGYKINHVMNLTDVDDKTIRDSRKTGKTLKAFTDFYAREFFKDIKSLNILPATKYPRATAHIKEMVALIQILLRKKLAYKTEDGVYFDISRFAPYGKLSRVKAQKLKSGTRMLADEYTKEEAQDFALWKMKKPGEPFWKSPFGEGRPGWHIECSAMSMKYLGHTFDIHAGAVDLLFPHHEDEIAQSEGATGKPFVRYFIEGEHLMVDGKKMSKSLGNFYALRDIEKHGIDPMAFRYLTLNAHYRTRLNFTWKSLESAQSALNKLTEFIQNPNASAKKGVSLDPWREKFINALTNDLDMPRALSVIWDLINACNKIPVRFNSKDVRMLIIEFDRTLGLGLGKTKRLKIPEQVISLVEKREKLRKGKKWDEADNIRKKIREAGFAIEDTNTGPLVRRI